MQHLLFCYPLVSGRHRRRRPLKQVSTAAGSHSMSSWSSCTYTHPNHPHHGAKPLLQAWSHPEVTVAGRIISPCRDRSEAVIPWVGTPAHFCQSPRFVYNFIFTPRDL
jgi:hypothetical protein